MKKHILCFGDSNTHGMCSDPSDCEDGGIRFNENERWTCLLQDALGPEYKVIEEGLNSRTTVFDDPLIEGLAGIDYISPCLRSHAPIDLLTIMLGTNDVKERFGASPRCIALGMIRLIKAAKATECWGEKEPNILLITPTAIKEGLYSCIANRTMGPGSVEKSQALAKEYKEVSEELNVHYFDANTLACELNTVDFIHLTKKDHAKLAAKLAEIIPELV